MNETDRELLELAAKAAGLSGQWSDCHKGICYSVPGDLDMRVWNPLTNRTDRYDLVRRLNGELDFLSCRVRLWGTALSAEWFYWTPYGDEKAEALTIVRAAAEFGRRMS